MTPGTNLAASLQAVLEEVVLGLLRELAEKTKLTDLCMAGGVALNCTMNGKIASETPFERVFIQPAAYDGGTALGAALYVKHQVLGAPRDFTMNHTYWGARVFARGVPRCARRSQASATANSTTTRWRQKRREPIERGQIVGWYQGRFEWGPAPSATAASSAIRETRR